MKVIGLVGEKRAGKGTVSLAIKDLLPVKVSIHRFSAILTDTLKRWYLELTRENYQKLTPVMRNTYGADVLARAVKKDALAAASDVVILDGVRWWVDYDMIRSFPDNLLIYVTASLKTRFSRSGEEKAHEGDSWEKFLEEENAETERDIADIGFLADYKIINDGSRDELRQKVKEILEIHCGLAKS